MTALETISFKVVVVGPFGAGKTTLISAISEVPVVSTDVAATSADESARKSATTVSMDFGVRSVRDDELEIKLFVYGTPGQERFSFMWDILANGMDGFVLLVDAKDPDSWPAARRQLEYFRGLGGVPHVIGANRAAGDASVLPELAGSVGAGAARMVPCDVTDLESAKALLIELLAEVLERLTGEDELDPGGAPPVPAPVAAAMPFDHRPE